MKSKITSFIISIMTMLMVVILCFLGIIIYNELNKTNIANEVEEFVSNITISSDKDENDLNMSNIIKIDIEQSEKKENNINNLDIKVEKIFYNQLNKYSKIIYNAMSSNKENMKTGTYEIDFGTKFSQLLSQNNGDKLLGEYYQSAIESYTYDNPDIFYIEFSKLCLNIETTTRGDQKTYRVFINQGNNLNYLTEEFSSKEKINTALNEIEKIKAYFIHNKKEKIYDNIKLVHDYLVESIEYDESISEDNIYNLYGALINKKSVCEGYAKAFKYLMDSINIPCTIVSRQSNEFKRCYRKSCLELCSIKWDLVWS